MELFHGFLYLIYVSFLILGEEHFVLRLFL